MFKTTKTCPIRFGIVLLIIDQFSRKHNVDVGFDSNRAQEKHQQTKQYICTTMQWS